MEYIYEENRIYSLDENNKVIAEIDFENGCISHTFVDEAYGGRGIAKELVEKAIEEIRKQNLPLSATCSYALNYFKKNGINL